MQTTKKPTEVISAEQQLGEIRSWFIESPQSLLKWNPGKDPYNQTVLCPLNPRPKTSKTPRLVHWNDMGGAAYVPGIDVAVQGSLNSDTYNFSHWQWVDIFAYMFHGFIAPPPPAWTNAAHKNGVLSLGTITPPYLTTTGGQWIHDMIQIGTRDQYLKQLMGLAEYYGFDGWALNFEINLPGEETDAKLLIEFLELLSTRLKATDPNRVILWYNVIDAISGQYSNEQRHSLTETNIPFLKACDGVFIDYPWYDNENQIEANIKETLASVSKVPTRSAQDVYMGVDVEKYGSRLGSIYGEVFSHLKDTGLSLGLYGPGTTYCDATGSDPYQPRERKLWLGEPSKGYYVIDQPEPSISKAINVRPCPSNYPIITTFDTGSGQGIYIEGARAQRVFNEKLLLRWSNMSSQSLLPDMRFAPAWPPGAPDVFKAELTHDWAWDGGTSLRVWNDKSGPKDSENCTSINLFKCDFDYTPGKTKLCIVYRDDISPQFADHRPYAYAPLELFVILYGGNKGGGPIQTWVNVRPDYVSRGEQLKMQILSFNEGAQANFPFRVEAIHVRPGIKSDRQLRTSALIGHLALLNEETKFSGKPVKNMACRNKNNFTTAMDNLTSTFDLCWEPGLEPNKDRHYNVYYSNVNPATDRGFDASTVWFLGRAFVNQFRVEQFRFDNNKDKPNAYFLVQPMDKNGFNQPLAECAILKIDWE